MSSLPILTLDELLTKELALSYYLDYLSIMNLQKYVIFYLVAQGEFVHARKKKKIKRLVHHLIRHYSQFQNGNPQPVVVCSKFKQRKRKIPAKIHFECFVIKHRTYQRTI